MVSGIPLPPGYTSDTSQLVVLCAQERNPLLCSAQAMSRWPDGSIRWCLLKVMCSGKSRQLLLQNKSGGEPVKSQQVTLGVTGGETVKVVDGELIYRFNSSVGFPDIAFGDLLLRGEEWRLSVFDMHRRDVKITFSHPQLLHFDSLSATIVINGKAVAAEYHPLNFTLYFEIFAGQEMVLTCEVHNLNRAYHPHGIWDLGDDGSILLDSVQLQIPVKSCATMHLQVENDDPWRRMDIDADFELYQASSGGEHWNSINHVDRCNRCTCEFKGYQLSLGDDDKHEGIRATPALVLETTRSNCMSMRPIDFWQNFPKKLTYKKKDIVIGLFPSIENDLHEIQGGERKQHGIHFAFGTDPVCMRNCTTAMYNGSSLLCDRTAYKHHNLLGNPVCEESGVYDELINVSLDASLGFVAKRENQDEFGWRHFGDVVADHESLYATGESKLISHYNNQYDCIYGFARQFLLTGEMKWYRLMDDLARHVLDIDIYRTDKDRVEYNHGLFWHTDHYLSASTATHRTYSHDHYPPDWTGPKGGGPGAEHCYTTGLKMYHYVTGSSDARDAVIKMTDWVTNYYEGSGTFIEFVKSIVAHDLKKLGSTLRGYPVLRYRYALSRGVGNYIRALLDCHELTDEFAYLQKAGNVLNNTFSATDEIGMRKFEDIEGTWFYTVFLQEVVRFLDVKRLHEQYDNDFHIALNGFLHYAHWMLEHEKPYLAQAEKLEYPNDTWVGQDIRKANILYSAYLYSRRNRQQFLERARYFRDYVTDTLRKSDTLHYARIQTLLLQNHGPADAMNSECEPYNYSGKLSVETRSSIYDVRDFIHSFKEGLVRVLRTTNPRREYQWVNVRLGK